MKKLIIAGVISLFATTAFALDKNLGGTNEYSGSLTLDHGPGAPQTDKLAPDHDHGDDTIKNFTDHKHEGSTIVKSSDGANKDHIDPMHDHGDDTIKNFVEHTEH